MTADMSTVIFSVIEHLASLEPNHPMESREALTNAMTSLGEAFGLDTEDPTQARKFSLKPHTLDTIFSTGAKSLGAKSADQTLAELESNDAFKQFVKVVSTKGYFKGVTEGTPEYDERMSKLVSKFKTRTEAASSGSGVREAGTGPVSRGLPTTNSAATGSDGSAKAGATPATGAKAEKEKKAEEVKGRGNKLLLEKDYEGAEACYSEALELSPDGPNSHVYLCNRAFALCYLGRHDDAVVDCQEAVELNPQYAKAHTRLGYAYYQLEDYEASADAYRRSLELEPNNAANTKILKKALAKLGQNPSAADGITGSTDRGMPDLSALASAMGGGSGAGGGGGLASMMAAMGGAGGGGAAGTGAPGDAGGAGGGGLASMMAAMAGAGGGAGASGGGAGGADGLAGMLNNPAMMAQAQTMMQNPQMMSQVQAMMSNPQMMSSIMGMMGGGGGGGSGGGPDLSALAGLMGGAGAEDGASEDRAGGSNKR